MLRFDVTLPTQVFMICVTDVAECDSEALNWSLTGEKPGHTQGCDDAQTLSPADEGNGDRCADLEGGGI